MAVARLISFTNHREATIKGDRLYVAAHRNFIVQNFSNIVGNKYRDSGKLVAKYDDKFRQFNIVEIFISNILIFLL